MQDTEITLLEPSWQQVLQAALSVRELAYAPYSGFQVGAAILGGDGRVFTGCNVENASYGLSLCAERSAAAAAVSSGLRDFRVIALTGKPVKGSLDEPLAPCGACRQFLYTFKPAFDTLTVLMADSCLQRIRIATIEALLPCAFGQELD